MNTKTAIEVSGKLYSVTDVSDAVLQLVGEDGREYIGMPTHKAPAEYYLSGMHRNSKILGTFTL